MTQTPTSMQMWCMPPSAFFFKNPSIGLLSPRGCRSWTVSKKETANQSFIYAHTCTTTPKMGESWSYYIPSGRHPPLYNMVFVVVCLFVFACIDVFYFRLVSSPKVTEQWTQLNSTQLYYISEKLIYLFILFIYLIASSPKKYKWIHNIKETKSGDGWSDRA